MESNYDSYFVGIKLRRTRQQTTRQFESPGWISRPKQLNWILSEHTQPSTPRTFLPVSSIPHTQIRLIQICYNDPTGELTHRSKFWCVPCVHWTRFFFQNQHGKTHQQIKAVHIRVHVQNSKRKIPCLFYAHFSIYECCCCCCCSYREALLPFIHAFAPHNTHLTTNCFVCCAR